MAQPRLISNARRILIGAIGRTREEISPVLTFGRQARHAWGHLKGTLVEDKGCALDRAARFRCYTAVRCPSSIRVRAMDFVAVSRGATHYSHRAQSASPILHSLSTAECRFFLFYTFLKLHTSIIQFIVNPDGYLLYYQEGHPRRWASFQVIPDCSETHVRHIVAVFVATQVR
jgi:hypothetical protein